MSVLGLLLIACVALALLRAVLAILALCLLGAGIYALIVYPAGVLSVGCLLLFMGLASKYPTTMFALVAIVLVASLIAKVVEETTHPDAE